MKRIYLFLLLLLAGSAAHACSASFSASMAPSGGSLLNVNFTNSSSYGTPFTSQLKTGRIHYGDGSYSFYYGTSLPAHTYSAPGTYTAKLVVQSIDSSTFTTVCSDSTTISVTVAYPPCGTIISASGTGATRSFSVSNPASTAGIAYSWNFGDGTTGTGTSPSHTYSSTGNYTVTCTSTVGAPVSCTYTNSISIYVVTPAAPLTCSSLSANFNVSVLTGSTIATSNTSSTVSFPYNMRTFWSFGDGTTSLLWAPTHTYTAAGTYSVKLKTEWRDSLTGTTLCSDSITKSVTVSSISTANISGIVMFDTSTYPNQAFKVWLIQFNAATNILSAVDSVNTPTGPAGYFTFNNKPAGNYLVKAAVLGGPTSGTGLVPTYYPTSTIWSGATTVTATPGSSVSAYIFMQAGTVTSGPGFVGGNVSLGANKGAANGVAGLTMLLRNGSNNVVQMATTDANGDFRFSNIPSGTYTVYPELLNYATIPASVTVSGSNTNINGVNFNQDDVKMNIAPRSLSVGSHQSNAAQWSIAPNPASGRLLVSWKGLSQEASGIIIVNITGETVIKQSFTGAAGTKQIDITTLRPGLYFVRGNGGLQGQVEKLIVE